MEKQIQYTADCSCCETSAQSQNQQPDNQSSSSAIKIYIPAIFSFILLVIGLALDFTDVGFFNGWARVLWYAMAYLPVGFPVLKQGYLLLLKGNFFSEFNPKGVANIWCFGLGEIP